MDIVASNQLHIRSKDCVAYQEGITTNFHLTLESPIICYSDEMIIVNLATAEIPYTFNGVNVNNNVLEFEEYDYDIINNIYSNPRTIISIRITKGNYNITQLMDEVIEKMNNNSVFSNPYSVVYNEITNTLIISINSNIIGCKLLVNSGINKNKSIFTQLGYSKDTDILFNSNIDAISDGNVDLATIHSIYLRTNLGLINTLSSSTRNITNILTKIPINVNALEMIYFTPLDRSGYNLLQQTSIKHIQISITDQNDNIIDLGKNINWELSLVFDIIKKPNRTYTAYKKIDYNEKIITPKKEIIKTEINDLYNKPIRNLDIRPVDIKQKLIKPDIDKDIDKFNSLENKINQL
tara:strand:- start:1849 stop:2901 length:1053 start_codon:yes stop_codon:yes gene_type:complete